jgi:dTDP-4-dehydrorhamnose 3,5-epimerase
MEFHHYEIPGLVEVRPRRIGDARGYFSEIFRVDLFNNAAGETVFVQENESLSVAKGTIRGLHFQTAPFVQGKLVRCVKGAIFDVAVDLRQASPAYGKWASVILTPETGNQLWIPGGFAHGFCTLEPETIVNYKVTSSYSRPNDKGIRWNDPDIGIEWPDVADIETLSLKDQEQPLLADLPPLFHFER